MGLKQDRSIRLLEIPSELGAGTRGASLGPGALRAADISSEKNLLRDLDFASLIGNNQVLLHPQFPKEALNIEAIAELLPRITQAVNSALDDGFFPLIVSGDHSNAAGTVSGVKNFIGEDKRLGVIWIDAHADLHTPYTTPSGNVHGMPLGALLAEDNIELKINNPDEQTLNYWDSIKRLGSKRISPKISTEDLVFIDIRDLEKQEWEYIEQNNILHWTPDQVQQSSMQQIAEKALQHLSGCDAIYISFDVDSMDPEISAGTGTPVPNGLKKQQASDLLSALLQDKRVVTLEITEINPLLDQKNKMAETVLGILEDIL